MSELDAQTQINALSHVLTFAWFGSVLIAYYAGKWRGQLKGIRQRINLLESEASEVAD